MIKAYDTFYRTDQAGFGTSSSGKIWTPGAGGAYSVAGHRGLVVGTGGADSNAQLGTDILTDQDIYCRIIIGDAGDVPAVQGRFTAAGPFDYKVVWFGGSVHLSKAIGGVNTHLITLPFPMTPGAGYWFHLRCKGTAIAGNAWQDGTPEPLQWMMQATDNSIASGGYGILANSGAGPGIQYDSFVATDSTDQTGIALIGGGGLVAGIARI